MGFSSADWTGIDSYVAPLRTNENSTRSDHVEAMIAQAMEYRGQPWVSGAASSPAYGLDCSGLVTQAMYASGVSPFQFQLFNMPNQDMNGIVVICGLTGECLMSHLLTDNAGAWFSSLTHLQESFGMLVFY